MRRLGWAAVAGVCAGAVFDLGGAILLRKWTALRPTKREKTTPITILRPIKRGVRGLSEILQRTLEAMHPEDQLLVGVPADSREAAEVGSLRDPRLQVVPCPESKAGNPKIEKLTRMAPLARNPIWCLIDAEAQLSRELLQVCRDRCDERTLVTASYYYGEGDSTVWDRMDQATFYGFFWPGVAWARCGTPAFAFGACMALRRELLEHLGGLNAFTDRLAEDYWLGKETVAKGGEVLQVPVPVELSSDHMSGTSFWKTIRRRMVTYRTCRPESFVGTVATQGPMWASLLVALGPAKPWRWLVFLASLGMRSGAVLANRKSVSRDKCILRSWEVPMFALAASVLETAAWALAWISPRIEWSGRKLRIGGDGRIR